MPWLVVLGSGTWTAGRGQRFKPGKHEVSDELAEKVISLNRPNLRIFRDEPDITKGVGPGPLTPEDVKRGTTAGVRITEEEQMVEELEAEYEIPLTYECQWCPQKRPSQAAMDRHHRVAHPEFVRG